MVKTPRWNFIVGFQSPQLEIGSFHPRNWKWQVHSLKIDFHTLELQFPFVKLNLSYCSKEPLLIIRNKLIMIPTRDAWASERQSALILHWVSKVKLCVIVNICLDVRVCEESSSVSGLFLKNYRVRGWNTNVWPFTWKLLSNTFM